MSKKRLLYLGMCICVMAGSVRQLKANRDAIWAHINLHA
jgi:hypothetical protein